VTAEAHAQARFRRAIECRALWMAEDAARELPKISLSIPSRTADVSTYMSGSGRSTSGRRWHQEYAAYGVSSLPPFRRSEAQPSGIGSNSAAARKGVR
jgi:hypothetical protein